MKYKNQPMKEYNIASIAGDGIGKEVLPESLKILKETAKKHQFKIQFDEFEFSSIFKSVMNLRFKSPFLISLIL